MSGIFPQGIDGALRANADTPNNPPQAYEHQWTLPADTAPLYYSGACNLRMRPSVVNSVISEIAATADRARVPYRFTSLQNLETSIRYLIQRGEARGAVLQQEDPWHFTVTLDPPALQYSDYMTLTLVPQFLRDVVQNQGYVRISCNDLGFIPLLRNDGEEMRAYDLLPYKPFICTYFSGAFYYIGLANSQVPLTLIGAVNFWIRPDGNDETGDGSGNTPAKAFRTIDGAWRAVGTRYAASSGSNIILRLGMQGEYEGGEIGPFGSNVTLMGDPWNAEYFRVVTKAYGEEDEDPIAAWSLRVFGVNNFTMSGVNLVMHFDEQTPNGVQCLRVHNSSALYANSRFTIEKDNARGHVILCEAGALLQNAGVNFINGNNRTVAAGVVTVGAANHPGQPAGSGTADSWWTNIRFSSAGYLAQDRSAIGQANTNIHVENAIGPRYLAVGASIIYSNGQPIPGSTPGSTGSLGQAL